MKIEPYQLKTFINSINPSHDQEKMKSLTIKGKKRQLISMKVEREKWVVAPLRETIVFRQLAGAWEDDEPNLGITKHRKLLSIFEQPSSTLWEGDLPIGVVLNPPYRDLSTSHLSNSLVLSLFLVKDVKKKWYMLCHFHCLDFLAWRYKKQDHISKSSTEVEYRVMSTICSEIVWLRGILEEL